MHLSRPLAVTSWLLQLLVAAILLQTLFFKFTGAPESRYIFSTLGVEPWGRIASGIVELIAATLILIPRTAALGAALSAAVISGAIGAHLTRLGISIPDPVSPGSSDGGLLFGLAVAVLLGSLAVAAIRRAQLPLIGKRFASSCGCAHACALPRS